jgi:RNase H-fold protein (predicted Holliday junction resolvase)
MRKVKIQIPFSVEIEEQEVRKIVANYLREKYDLQEVSFDYRKWVDGKELVIEQYDVRGKPLPEIRRKATKQELAANTILKTLQ